MEIVFLRWHFDRNGSLYRAKRSACTHLMCFVDVYSKRCIASVRCKYEIFVRSLNIEIQINNDDAYHQFSTYALYSSFNCHTSPHSALCKCNELCFDIMQNHTVHKNPSTFITIAIILNIIIIHATLWLCETSAFIRHIIVKSIQCAFVRSINSNMIVV